MNFPTIGNTCSLGAILRQLQKRRYMKTTAIFVILQYIAGFAFGIGGMFLLPEKNNWSLNSSIFYTLLWGFIAMLMGVGIVGYFHLRVKKVTNRFVIALMLSAAGSLLFLFASVFIQTYIPMDLEFLSLILPLTGAVFGFNLTATMRIRNEKTDI